VPPDNQPATYLSVGMSGSNGSFTSTPFPVQQLDDIAPVIGITTSPALENNNTVNQPATFTVNVVATDDDSGIASTVIMLDQTAISNGYVVNSSTLSLGTHTITVTATDNAGNTATSTLTFTVAAAVVNISCSSTIADVNQLYQSNDISKEKVKKHIIKELEKACKKINDDDDVDDDDIDDDDINDGNDTNDSNKAHEKFIKELNKVLHYISTNGDAISHMTNRAREVITADVQWLIAHH
jgi:hypothetical protein